MRVFVAGATGGIGTELVPQLAAAGHDVIGMTRSSAKTDMLLALGARPVGGRRARSRRGRPCRDPIATPASRTGSSTTLQGETS